MYGWFASVCTDARAMNDRYVGLTPEADWYSFFSVLRAATTRDMSTSIALVTCADVSSDLRMWSAMPRRIAETGSSCSPACACAGGAGVDAGFGGAGGAAAGAGGGGGGPPSSRPAPPQHKGGVIFF